MVADFVIAPLELILIFRGRLPLRAQVEQVHEEVIGQRLWTMATRFFRESSTINAAKAGLAHSIKRAVV